jgi:cytochrome P450
MTVTTADQIYYDPISHAVNAEPYALFKRMRDEAPLYYNERYDFYVLSRFSDVFDARFDWKSFCSADGVMFERMLDPALPRLPMLEMDPPDHRQTRKIVMRRFSHRAVAALEPRIRELCAGFLEPYRGSSGFDFTAVVARQLPMTVICMLLGIDPADQAELRPLFAAREAALAAETDHPDVSQAVANERKLVERLTALGRERRRAPRDDMMTAIVDGEWQEADGTVRPLTDAEIGEYILLLFNGGNSTTSLLLGWACALLGRHPSQRAKLVEQPGLIPNAIEEILRYEPVSTMAGRHNTREVTYYGTTVPPGNRFLLLSGAAARDEREYARPDAFDVRREIARHMAFGWGLHACIGAGLARLEARVVIEEMLARFRDWTIDEQHVALRLSSTLRGYGSLPIQL